MIKSFFFKCCTGPNSVTQTLILKHLFQGCSFFSAKGANVGGPATSYWLLTSVGRSLFIVTFRLLTSNISIMILRACRWSVPGYDCRFFAFYSAWYSAESCIASRLFIFYWNINHHDLLPLVAMVTTFDRTPSIGQTSNILIKLSITKLFKINFFLKAIVFKIW